MTTKTHSHSCHHHQSSWYKDSLFIFCVISLLGVAVTPFFQSTHMVFHHFLEYLHLMWWAILVGLVAGGLIDHFLPQQYIEAILAQPKKRTLVYAVGLGFLLSACSHGILAIAMQLYKKGASIPAVVAFLLASPWANLPVTILLFGFFGHKAFLLIGLAVVIAFITGYIFQILEKKAKLEQHPHQQPKSLNLNIGQDMKQRWQKHSFSPSNLKADLLGVLNGMWSLTKMVLWWIIIGMVFASIARAFVPHDFILQYLGATPMGMALTLCVATVLEVCSEGTAPLAFELYHHTKAFGNVFIFLMAGVATDYTEIGLIWKNIGWKTALLLPLITVPQIVLLGIWLNTF